MCLSCPEHDLARHLETVGHRIAGRLESAHDFWRHHHPRDPIVHEARHAGGFQQEGPHEYGRGEAGLGRRLQKTGGVGHTEQGLRLEECGPGALLRERAGELGFKWFLAWVESGPGRELGGRVEGATL